MQSPRHPSDQRLRNANENELRQEAIAWLARMSDRDTTPEDREACRQWQARSPAHARMFERLAGEWADPELTHAAVQFVHAGSLENARIPDRRQPSGWRYVIAGAACMLALLSGAWYFDVLIRWQADYYTEVGERRNVRLPDQSVATLNTGTALVLSFDGPTRHVRLLRGEASFNVQPDPDRPFVVEGAETATRAVGTEFVVRRQDGSDRVIVLEGTVEVSLDRNAGPVERVSAGSMTETNQGRLSPARPVDVSTAAAWRQGLLVVDGMPLGQVLEEVQRYYAGTIVLLNREVGKQRVTGTFQLDDTANILHHLSKSFSLRSVSLADRLVMFF